MTELLQRWRERAATLQEAGFEDVANAYLKAAVELESYTPSDELVTLRQAVELCEYSYQHLWRLVHKKRLTNFGQGRNILVRVRDLPRKAGSRS